MLKSWYGWVVCNANWLDKYVVCAACTKSFNHLGLDIFLVDQCKQRPKWTPSVPSRKNKCYLVEDWSCMFWLIEDW